MGNLDKLEGHAISPIHYSLRIFIICASMTALIVMTNVYIGLVGALYDKKREHVTQVYLQWMSREIQGALLRSRMCHHIARRLCGDDYYKNCWCICCPRRWVGSAKRESSKEGFWITLFPFD